MPPHPLFSQVDVFLNGYDLILCRSDLPLLITGCRSGPANASLILSCGGFSSCHTSINITKKIIYPIGEKMFSTYFPGKKFLLVGV